MNAHQESSLPKQCFSSSNVMQELRLQGIESHEEYGVQLKLWDAVMEVISISKELSFLYVCSHNDKKSDSNDLFDAFNRSKKKVHEILETFLNTFISKEYDNEENTSSNIETHDQTQVSQENIAQYECHSKSSDGQFIAESEKCVKEQPRYRSRSRSQEYIESSENKIRPKTTIKYPSETEFRSKSRKFNRSPSYSRIQTITRTISWASPNSLIPIQCDVRNRSRSKSKDKYEHDTKSMHPPVKRHRSQSRHFNRSPPSDRIETQHGRRNRSRSRSHDGPKIDSRSTVPTKRRAPRIREKRQCRLPDRRKHVTTDKSSSKSKQYSSSSSSKKFKNEKRQNNLQSPSKKSKFSPPTEEPPTPVIDSDTTMIPPQNAYQVPGPFYQNPHNALAMFYPPSQYGPRFIASPYYMPTRPHLAYPSTYPGIFYRPYWEPEAQNFDAQ